MITRQGSIRGLVNNIRRERERQLGAASEVIDAVMEMWSDGDATGHAAGPTSEIETISPFFPLLLMKISKYIRLHLLSIRESDHLLHKSLTTQKSHTRLNSNFCHPKEEKKIHCSTRQTFVRLGEIIEAIQRKVLFSSEKILDFGTVALSFVCDKYYPIID